MHPTAQKLQDLASAARLAGNREAGDALAQAAAVVEKARALVTVEKTLRDEMAMAALRGRLARVEPSSYLGAATWAYEMADAMLEAREV